MFFCNNFNTVQDIIDRLFERKGEYLFWVFIIWMLYIYLAFILALDDYGAFVH